MPEPISAGVTAAAGRAAVRALGPLLGGVRSLRERRALRRRAITVTFDGTAEVEAALESLSPTVRARIADFTKTAEFENVCFQVAIAARMPGDPEDHLAELRQLFSESLRLYPGVPDEAIAAVAGSLFVEITAAAWEEVRRYDKKGNLAKFSLTPEIVASHVAAAARNADIHKSLNDLTRIDDFAIRLARQCAKVHGKIRPAQIESGTKVAIEKLYVEPKLTSPRDPGGQQSAKSEEIGVREGLIAFQRVVILGDPGGGKTTLALKLMIDVARGKTVGAGTQTPLRVILRDYADRFKADQESIIQFLEKQSKAAYSISAPEDCIEYLLLNGRAVVIFDGLDELTDTSLRTRVVEAVEAFAHAYPTAPILVTSRRVGYEMAPLDDELFETFHLSPFDKEQKENYVRKWFDSMRQDTPSNRKHYADRFLVESEHASDISSNPLMLGLMCALYRGEGYIPRNRPDLYRRCSEFLFERWDSSRGISVAQPFERGIQFALFSLALNMMSSADSRTGLTENRLVRFTSDFLLDQQYEDRDVADAAARAFVEFCRGRAWVLTDVGTDAGGERLYSFTHRTFLEYFSARQLVRSNSSAPDLYATLRERLKGEAWEVTAQLAVQFLDERLENAANDFVAHALADVQTADDLAEKISLVGFCARLLEFVVLRPAIVRDIVAALCDLERFRSASKKMKALDGAWSGLTVCAAEVRPVAADELFNQFRSDGRSSHILLAVMNMSAVIPKTAGIEVREFWVSQEKIAASEFSASLRELSVDNRELASLAYLHGAIGVADLVQMHGTGILFESFNEGPRSYFHLLGEVAFYGGPRAHAWSPYAFSEKMTKELAQLLLNLPTPYVDGVSFTIHAHQLEGARESPDVCFLHLVNWCLEVENNPEVEKYAASKIPDLFMRNLANSRVSGSPPAKNLIHEHIPVRYMDFLRAWAGGAVSLLGVGDDAESSGKSFKIKVTAQVTKN